MSNQNAVGRRENTLSIVPGGDFSPASVVQQLAEPFMACELELLTKPFAAVYVDARTFERRLNKVLPLSWSFRLLPERSYDEKRNVSRDGVLILHLPIGDREYCSTGTETADTDKGPPKQEKGVDSDCFKRCCFRAGIGTYVYELPKTLSGPQVSRQQVEQAARRAGYYGPIQPEHYGSMADFRVVADTASRGGESKTDSGTRASSAASPPVLQGQPAGAEVDRSTDEAGSAGSVNPIATKAEVDEFVGFLKKRFKDPAIIKAFLGRELPYPWNAIPLDEMEEIENQIQAGVFDAETGERIPQHVLQPDPTLNPETGEAWAEYDPFATEDMPPAAGEPNPVAIKAECKELAKRLWPLQNDMIINSQKIRESLGLPSVLNDLDTAQLVVYRDHLRGLTAHKGLK